MWRGIRYAGAAALVASTVAVLAPAAASNAARQAGAVARSAATSTKPKIWYVNPLFSYPLWQTSSNYFKQEAATNGYHATVVGNTQLNIPQQLSDIDEAVTAGAQGIITCDLDPKTFGKTIKAAEAKGVVMVTIGCVDSISDYSVGTDNAAWGIESAQIIAKHAGPDAVVGAVGTNLTTPNQAAAYHAFVAYAKVHYPKMHIVATEFDNSDPTKAASETTAMLTAYPNINAIWLFEGFAPSVMPRALAEAGKKPGQLFVLGVDALPATEAAIKSGWVSETLAQCWFWAGPFAAKLIAAKLAGHGPKQQSFNVKLYEVTKSRLPFNGCPASAYPSI